jgi:uncharacterized membrane protein YkvA (DUF1232 family)
MDWRPIGVVASGLVLAWLAVVTLLWIFRPRGVRLGELVRVVPDIVRLCRSLVRDPGVPLGVKAAIFGLLLWLLSPIDLVPEFLPVIGPLDDVVVAVLVLRYARRRVGDDVLRQRWPGSPEGYRLLRTIIGGDRP